MVTGFVSRRSSQRIPFQVEIGIQFALSDNELIIANTTNLSPEGVRFFLPKGTIKFAPEEIIELVFALPNRGKITVQGEICYFSNAVDGDLKPVVYYGVKFLNVSPEDEAAIQDFCDAQLSGELEAETAASAVEESTFETVSEPRMDSDTDFASPSEPTAAEADQSINPSDEPLPTIPSLDDDENAFHSLSQEIIDQIVQSMQPHTEKPTKPADNTLSVPPKHNESGSPGNFSKTSVASAAAQPHHAADKTATTKPVDPKSPGMPSKPTISAKASESRSPEPGASELSQNEAILEKIRQLAESINIKFDEELFHSLQPKTGGSPKPDSGATHETKAETPADHSLENKFLDILEQPVNRVDLSAKDTSESADQTVLPGMDTSFLKKSAQSNLIDVLYGEEPEKAANNQTKSHTEANRDKSNPYELKIKKRELSPSAAAPKAEFENKIAAPERPAQRKPLEKAVEPVHPTPKPSAAPVSKEPVRPVKPFFNVGNNNSNVSMDQRMIDQIVQSMTQKK